MPTFLDPDSRRPPGPASHDGPARVDPDRTSPGTFLAALLGPLAVWGAAMALAGAAASPDVPDGQCSGIGFGCTLAPRDAAWFAGVAFGLPAVAVATLVLLLCLAAPPRARTGLVAGILVTFALLVAVVTAAAVGSTGP